MTTINIQMEGLDDLRRKLSPRTYEKAVATMMEDIAIVGERTAKQRAPRDTGALKRSIHSDARPLSARIFSNLSYAVPVEYGRKPGKPPPVGALRGWGRRHGWNPYALAYVIGKYGTKKRRGKRGRFFMKAALDIIRKDMPKFVRQASGDIAKRWSK